MNEINVYHINCKTYLMKDITYQRMQTEITAFVDKTLLQSEEYKTLHNTNCFKNYVFSGFQEIEKDKCYKEGKLYTFAIRCIDENLAKYLQAKLAITYTESIKGLSCQCKFIKKIPIQKMYLVTPCVAKFDEGYWKGNHSFTEFQQRLFINAIRKYHQYTGTSLGEDFQLYTNIKLVNQKPIKIKYKNINLLGDKLELVIADNENAQELAYFLLGTGILELNSRGCGFANYQAM